MKFYLVSGILTLLIGIFATFNAMKDLDAKYNGEIVFAKCLTTPELCFKRNNKIDVEFQGKTYIQSIGGTSCSNKKYKVGEKYKFLYSKKFNHLVFPKRKTEIIIPILIAIFTISIYCFWRMKKAS